LFLKSNVTEANGEIIDTAINTFPKQYLNRKNSGDMIQMREEDKIIEANFKDSLVYSSRMNILVIGVYGVESTDFNFLISGLAKHRTILEDVPEDFQINSNEAKYFVINVDKKNKDDIKKIEITIYALSGDLNAYLGGQNYPYPDKVSYVDKLIIDNDQNLLELGTSKFVIEPKEPNSP